MECNIIQCDVQYNTTLGALKLREAPEATLAKAKFYAQHLAWPLLHCLASHPDHRQCNRHHRRWCGHRSLRQCHCDHRGWFISSLSMTILTLWTKMTNMTITPTTMNTMTRLVLDNVRWYYHHRDHHKVLSGKVWTKESLERVTQLFCFPKVSIATSYLMMMILTMMTMTTTMTKTMMTTMATMIAMMMMTMMIMLPKGFNPHISTSSSSTSSTQT